jgi:hypothetical protein
MKLVNIEMLNRLWVKGIVPIKDALDKKLDESKSANNCTTTEQGYFLDARQGKVLQDEVDEINGNLKTAINNLFLLEAVSVNYSTSLMNGTSTYYIADNVTRNVAKSGYKAICAFIEHAGAAQINVYSMYVWSNVLHLSMYSGTSAFSGTAQVQILYAKNI